MEREGGYGDHDAIVSLHLMCLLKTGPKLFFIVPRAIQADPQAPRSNVNTLGSVVATVPKKEQMLTSSCRVQCYIMKTPPVDSVFRTV